MTRNIIFWVVAGEKAGNTKGLERVTHHTTGRFGSITPPPVPGADMESDLQDAPGLVIRPEPAATHVLVCFQEKDRPILYAVGLLGLHFLLEPAFDLSLTQFSPGIKELCHLRIAPKTKGQMEVIFSPVTKA